MANQSGDGQGASRIGVVSGFSLNSTSFPFLLSQEKILAFRRYRELVINLTGRDIKIRYKRSALGVLWAILQPVLMTLVFTVVFSSGFRTPLNNTPLYFLSGYALWNLFAQTVLTSMTVLHVNGALIKRVALPRSVFVVSALLTSLVTFLFSLIPLAVLLLLEPRSITPALLFLPVPVVVTSFFALGLALLLAPLALFFDDINHFLQVVMTMWFFLTPVVYYIVAIPPEYRILIELNPMTWMLEMFRAPVYYGALPEFSTLVLASAVAIVTLGIGWWSFARLSGRFVYYL